MVDKPPSLGFDVAPVPPRRLPVPELRSGPRVTIRLDGAELEAHANEPVAVALYAAGERVLSRSVKYHRPRGFFCLSGHCGACLARIDGKPNMKACRTLCKDGM